MYKTFDIIIFVSKSKSDAPALTFAPQERNHASCVVKDGAGAAVILLTASKGCHFPVRSPRVLYLSSAKAGYVHSLTMKMIVIKCHFKLSYKMNNKACEVLNFALIVAYYWFQLA
jgi:hypothetical protein